MSILHRPDDTEMVTEPVDTTMTSIHRRRRVVVALAALSVAVSIGVVALVTRTGGPASTLVLSRPTAAPSTAGTGPGSPSPSTGPTVTPVSPGPAAPLVPDTYRVVPLGFAGDVRGVNDRGDVVGARVFSGAIAHPFLWRDGTLTDLGELRPTLDGSGQANDINNLGQVVGTSRTEVKRPPVSDRAFLWRNGAMSALMPPDVDSVANAINDRGEIVGTYTVGPTTHGFVWRNGVVTDLGAGQAIAINERGQVAGVNATGVPWVWYQGTFTYLATGHAGYPRPVAINSAGWVVGSGSVERPNDMPDERAYLWRSGRMIDLGSIGVGRTYPLDINDWGQVIGVTNLNNFNDPIFFLWQDGQMIDLSKHGVLRPNAFVRQIDNRGRLFGTAMVGDEGQVVMYV